MGDLLVDTEDPVITYRGHRLGGTRHEAALLAALMTRPIRTHTCEELERQVWGSGAGGDSHAVDVHVAYLRRRLDVTLHPVIAGSCATGYRLTVGTALSNLSP